MDYLVAKVKRSNTYFIVLSDKTVYEDIPAFDHTYDYDDDKKLHEGEWFVLSDFTNKGYCPDIVKQAFSGVNYSYLERDKYKDIKYVISIQEEVTEFMELDVIDRDDEFNNEKVKTQNRRKIKEALVRYNNFDSNKKAKMPDYIRQYCQGLYDENTRKFKVSSEEDLTKLLNIINQRYYTTELDGEKRLANSVIIL